MKKNPSDKTSEGQIAHVGTLAVQATRRQLITAGSDAVKQFTDNGGKVRRFKKLVSQALAAVLESFKPKHKTVTADVSWSHEATSLPDPQKFMNKLHGLLGLKGTAKLIGDPNQDADYRADGLMPIISLVDLGREWEIIDPWGTGFCTLCERLIAEVTKVYESKVANYLADALKEQRVRVEKETKEAWMEYEEANAADSETIRYFLISVATGLIFNDQVYAPEDARNAVLEEGGLPLTLAHVVAILMTWPERLNRYNVRWMDIIGGEFRSADGDWVSCPCVDFDDGGLKLNAFLASYALSFFGATAGFPGVSGTS